MHLADGILTAPVAGTAALLSAGGVAVGLRKLDPDDVPRVGVLAAVFFVASLIHVPVGVASAHLLLNGLLGMLLGWAVFPALAAALLLQAIFFHFGGIVSLGANVLNMALPGVLAYTCFGRRLGCTRSPGAVFGWAACGGALGVLGAGLMMCLSLFLSGREFAGAAALVLGAHVPVMVVEAVVTGFVLSFLSRVRPEWLARKCGVKGKAVA